MIIVHAIVQHNEHKRERTVSELSYLVSLRYMHGEGAAPQVRSGPQTQMQAWDAHCDVPHYYELF